MIWFGRTRIRRKPGSLTKTVMLPPKEVYLRLALERSNHKYDTIEFNEYYTGLSELIEKRDSATLWMLALLSGIFLYKIEALINFELPWIQFEKSALGFILLTLFAAAALLWSNLQARIFKYQSLFQAAMESGPGFEKQHLLLKYPKAFSAFLYHDWISARPKFMHPVVDWPIRLIVAVICLLGFSIFALFAYVALILAVTIDLWRLSDLTFGIWGKAFICSSWAMLIYSTLLPTLAFRHIKFEHFGLSELLTRLSKTDPKRYNHFVRLINETEHGKTLSSRKSSNPSGSESR